jgi:hypothetical protein
MTAVRCRIWHTCATAEADGAVTDRRRRLPSIAAVAASSAKVGR